MTIRLATAFLAASCLVGPAFGATHTVLADYSAGAGATPSGLPVPDGTGAYIGAARDAPGINPSGSILRFAPPATAGAPWTETVIYSFAGGADGDDPECTLTADGSGGFLGTTKNGGSAGAGTVFQLTPPASPGGPWTHTVIYNFQGGSADAAQPHSRLVSDASGAFYGTAGGGGPGGGAVFKLVPPAGPGAVGGWTESVLAFFSGPPTDGRGPTNVALDPGGAIYVSLIAGGPTNNGEIVQLTPPTSGTLWTKSLVHAFVSGHGSTDGKFPRDIYRDSSGTLFGTTAEGGTAKMGTFYSLGLVGSTWTETILHNFAGGPSDGAKPVGAIVADGSGGFVGVTKAGGSGNFGAVVDLSPAGGGYSSTVLYGFLGHPDGSAPDQGVQPDGSGDYFGVTLHGGSKNKGTFYSLTP
jgi:hypothetical protein